MGNHCADAQQKKEKGETQEDVREWDKPGTFACAFVSLIQFQRNATGRPPKNACPTVPPLAVSASLSQQRWKCVGMLHASFQRHLNGPFSISHQGVLQGAGSGYQNSFYCRIRTN